MGLLRNLIELHTPVLLDHLRRLGLDEQRAATFIPTALWFLMDAITEVAEKNPAELANGSAAEAILRTIDVSGLSRHLGLTASQVRIGLDAVIPSFLDALRASDHHPGKWPPLEALQPANQHRPAAAPIDELDWLVHGRTFEDGSELSEWTRIDKSRWRLRNDGAEIRDEIFAHGAHFWMLVVERMRTSFDLCHRYQYASRACRAAQVRYERPATSPRSGLRKERGELEWVYVTTVDSRFHAVVRKGLQ